MNPVWGVVKPQLGRQLGAAYYLNLTDSSGIDMIKVEAKDFAGSGWVELVRHTTSGGTLWRTHQLMGSDFTKAGVSLTANARIRFDAVFESIPESAAGWALQAASSPSHPDPGASPPSTTPLAWE